MANTSEELSLSLSSFKIFFLFVLLTFSYSVSETVERQLDGMRTFKLPTGKRSLTTERAPVEPAAYGFWRKVGSRGIEIAS